MTDTLWFRDLLNTVWFFGCPICKRFHYTIEYDVCKRAGGHHRQYIINLFNGNTVFQDGWQFDRHGTRCPKTGESYYWKSRKLDTLLRTRVRVLQSNQKNHDLRQALSGEYSVARDWLLGGTRIRD